MAKGSVVALSKEQRLFLVERLACMDSVAVVQQDYCEQFGDMIDRELIYLHNAVGRNRDRMPDALVAYFDQVRDEFVSLRATIPILSKAFRARVLQRLLDKELGGAKINKVLVAQLLEQAAKEDGGAYTNHRKVDVAFDLAKLSDEELTALDRIQSKLTGSE